MTRATRRNRGTSLIEIMISLAVVLVGMLALFKTLATSVTGSMTASKLTQAQQRAVLIMEAIRVSPKPAILCLISTAPSSWGATCEPICLANLTGTGKTRDACIYQSLDDKTTNGGVVKLDIDQNQQLYSLVTSSSTGQPVSIVSAQGSNLVSSLFEAQVVIGWNDANTNASTDPDHYIVLRSGVYE